jgi:uncharacterized protein (DUF885 family)
MFRRTTGLIGAAAMLVLTSASAVATGAAPSHGADLDFDPLVADVAETMLARVPEDVTDLGLSGLLDQQDDRLNDLSRAYRLETARLAQDALDRIAVIDHEALTPDQRITRSVTEWYLDDLATMAGYLDHEYAVNYITGAHTTFPEFMADVHPITSVDQADAYVERIRRSATQMQQVADNLVRSQEEGYLPTETGTRIAAWQIGNQLTPASSHPLVTDLEARLATLDLSDAERERIIGAARIAVEEHMQPAYKALLSVVEAAATRSDSKPGVLHQPAGREFYAAALRHHTTTSLTPEEVHGVGIEQVHRLRDELTHALNAAGFDVEAMGFAGALDAAGAASPSIPLRSDGDREAVLRSTEAFIATAQGAFAPMFTTLPTSPIEVQRPRPGREGSAGAYYRPPPAYGERPGIYYLSLAGSAFETQTYATTNYHEAVPGHHFQLALQREAQELPLIQRATTFNGYAEGWALYAERLAHEAGLYENDPIGDIGRLRMELLRAGRAVADTGIHALGWSRSQAVDYLTDLGLPVPWASTEVDRYIVWPGQAPSYLVGMLEIVRLRSEAESALGDEFDLAAFHDAILRHGSVPVEALGEVVADHIKSSS